MLLPFLWPKDNLFPTTHILLGLLLWYLFVSGSITQGAVKAPEHTSYWEGTTMLPRRLCYGMGSSAWPGHRSWAGAGPSSSSVLGEQGTSGIVLPQEGAALFPIAYFGVGRMNGVPRQLPGSLCHVVFAAWGSTAVSSSSSCREDFTPSLSSLRAPTPSSDQHIPPVLPALDAEGTLYASVRCLVSKESLYPASLLPIWSLVRSDFMTTVPLWFRLPQVWKELKVFTIGVYYIYPPLNPTPYSCYCCKLERPECKSVSGDMRLS